MLHNGEDVTAVQPVHVKHISILEHGLNVDSLLLDDYVVVDRFRLDDTGSFDAGNGVDITAISAHLIKGTDISTLGLLRRIYKHRRNI